MSSRTTHSTAAIAFAALLVLSACATTDPAVTPEDYGHVRPEEQPAVAASEPTPIPGPAKVDSEGRVYTSSAVGSAGNAAAVGTNTNVNIVPEQAESTVTITETPVTTETTVQTPLVTERITTTIVETEPVPPPVVIERERTVIEERPMVSSVQETETRTTTRRRMSKD